MNTRQREKSHKHYIEFVDEAKKKPYSAAAVNCHDFQNWFRSGLISYIYQHYNNNNSIDRRHTSSAVGSQAGIASDNRRDAAVRRLTFYDWSRVQYICEQIYYKKQKQEEKETKNKQDKQEQHGILAIPVKLLENITTFLEIQDVFGILMSTCRSLLNLFAKGKWLRLRTSIIIESIDKFYLEPNDMTNFLYQVPLQMDTFLIYLFKLYHITNLDIKQYTLSPHIETVCMFQYEDKIWHRQMLLYLARNSTNLVIDLSINTKSKKIFSIFKEIVQNCVFLKHIHITNLSWRRSYIGLDTLDEINKLSMIETISISRIQEVFSRSNLEKLKYKIIAPCYCTYLHIPDDHVKCEHLGCLSCCYRCFLNHTKKVL
jgi:hypothetical protein